MGCEAAQACQECASSDASPRGGMRRRCERGQRVCVYVCVRVCVWLCVQWVSTATGKPKVVANNSINGCTHGVVSSSKSSSAVVGYPASRSFAMSRSAASIEPSLLHVVAATTAASPLSEVAALCLPCEQACLRDLKPAPRSRLEVVRADADLGARALKACTLQRLHLVLCGSVVCMCALVNSGTEEAETSRQQLQRTS